jgi:H+/Cl- antiporter ClcA
MPGDQKGGSRRDSAAYLKLVGYAAVIGVPAAFAAAAFLGLVHYFQHWLWTSLPDKLGDSSPPWYLVIGLPVVGAAIVVAARRWLPGDGGEEPLKGLSSTQPPISWAPGIIVAALATLSFGAVLGPEAPVIAIGTIVGVLITKVVPLPDKQRRVLGTAGAFSAISALFGGPIVGGVMLTESGAETGLGAALTPALVPGFVAAAIGYVIFIGFGHWGGLNVPGLAVPNLPPDHGTHVGELGLALVVGVVTALVLWTVRRFAGRLLTDGQRHLSMPVFLLAGGLAVGAIAQLAEALGANSQDVLFSGQAAIPALVIGSSTKIVLILLVGKAVAYAVSLACGFRGGPIFPALFLGVGIAALGVVWFGASPTVAIAAGAAAGMAAQTRLMLTSVLFGALLVGTGGAAAVPETVIAAAAAWITTTALHHDGAAAGAEPATAS